MIAHRIVVTHRLHDEVAQRLRQAGTLVMNESIEPWTEAEVDAQLRDADAWVAFMTDHVDARRLALASRLKVVAGALKGGDSFDAAACAQAGVWLTVVPDLLTAPTAELALGLAIAAARHVLPGHQRVRSGSYSGWRARDYGRGLEGSVCAVLGQGRLGSAIVDRLQGFSVPGRAGCGPASLQPPRAGNDAARGAGTGRLCFCGAALERHDAAFDRRKHAAGVCTHPDRGERGSWVGRGRKRYRRIPGGRPPRRICGRCVRF